MGLILNQVVNYAITTVLGACYMYIVSQRKKNKAFVNSQRALLKHAIVKTHEDCMQKTWISMHMLETTESMFAEYQALGGNSFVDTLVKDLRGLQKHSADSMLSAMS